MNAVYRIEMLGGLRIQREDVPFSTEDRVITRFSTHKTGALLAYLAYHLNAPSSPRELLADLFWPESHSDAGRTNLRSALASLRRQLEPPGIEPGSILVADRFSVHLNPIAVRTDVALFEAALHEAHSQTDAVARLRGLVSALSWYQGDLLPGFYDAWCLEEGRRLAQAYLKTLKEITVLALQTHDLQQAVDAANRVVVLDALNEEAQRMFIRLLAVTGQPEAALQQYATVERLLKEKLNVRPEPATTNLAAQIRRRQRSLARTVTSNDTLAEVLLPLHLHQPKHFPIPDRHKQHPSHLIVPLTRFFGRAKELEYLQALLHSDEEDGYSRLVTLTGIGGSGKTRLSIEVARQLMQRYGLSVCFVSLGEVGEPSEVPDAILRALQLPQEWIAREPAGDTLDRAIRGLSETSVTLLVLDNYEHLVTEEGVCIVQTLLARLPDLRCLVTSRQSLNIEGEQEVPVAPLPTPACSDTPQRLLQCASVQLFVDRAQAVRPDFQVTPKTAKAIAALCTRLEGIPLAVELAASWMPMFTPTQMLDRLERRLDSLISRRSNPLSRHRSLRAVLDSSFQLLTPSMQQFFMRLSVFRGGWTLASATTICEDPDALEKLMYLPERFSLRETDVPQQILGWCPASENAYQDRSLP